MKRKVLFIIAILLIVSSVSAFSWAIGGSFSLDPIGTDMPVGAMLSAKFDQFPFLLGLGVSGSSGSFNLGVTADWHFVRENLTGILNYYIGAGAYLGIGTDTFELGARIPVALYIFPIDNLELFLEIAPALGMDLSPFYFPRWHLQGAFGFRFWFN